MTESIAGSNVSIREMVDTNVLIYAVDPSSGAKHRIALDLIQQLTDRDALAVSAQVLNEFYAVTTSSKKSHLLNHDEAVRYIRTMAASSIVLPLTLGDTLLAVEAVVRHGLSFWDALDLGGGEGERHPRRVHRRFPARARYRGRPDHQPVPGKSIGGIGVGRGRRLRAVRASSSPNRFAPLRFCPIRSSSPGLGSSLMGILGARVMPCPIEERPAALEVLYRRMPGALRGYLIAEVLADERRGELDLSGLWVARIRSGRIVGALMTQALAGKAAALWPPEVRPSWRRAALAAGLVRAALEDLSARGYRVAQAALDESAGPQAARDLARGGMPRVTELLYLERETAPPLPVGGIAPGPCRRAKASRQPRPRTSNGGRSTRRSRPSSARSCKRPTSAAWTCPSWRARAGSTTSWPATRPPGCSCPSTGGSGASPASPRPRPCCSWPRPRAATPGRSSTSGSPPPPAVAGWDCAVIRYALELARGHVPILELAVDLRNTPAVQLYRATGFTPRDRRAVHLAVLG